MQYLSKSVQDTIQFACQWASGLKGGQTVLLSGDLGAGKTHFTKGIALALGIDETVTSPTFTLHNVYNGKLVLNHFDCYRITDEYEAEVLGLEELFVQPNAVAVIEWWQNVQSLLPSNAVEVTITKQDDDQHRLITIKQRG